MLACVDGNLHQVPVVWNDQCYVGVVLASGGYPGSYQTGFAISGTGTDLDDTTLFHAATRLKPDGDATRLVTSGGRVITVVGRGDSLAEARARAYDRVRQISFDGAIYRTDIAGPVEETITWPNR